MLQIIIDKKEFRPDIEHICGNENEPFHHSKYAKPKLSLIFIQKNILCQNINFSVKTGLFRML